MRNKLIAVLIAMPVILCMTCPYYGAAQPNTQKGASEGPAAHDKANIENLQAAEKGVGIVEDKFQAREEEMGARAEYERVKTIETNKADELKKEIWKIKDGIKLMVEKEDRLKADKERSDADLTEQTKAFKAMGESVKKAMEAAEAKDKQITQLKVLGEKEGESRKEKVSKLNSAVGSLADKIASLTKKRDGIANELTTHDAEYRAEVGKRDALKEKIAQKKIAVAGSKKKEDAASRAEDAAAENDLANLIKSVEDMTARDRALEADRQKISEEINTLSTTSKSRKEELASLDREDVSKSQNLKSQTGYLGEEKNAAQVEVDKIKKKELDAKAALSVAIDANKKLENKIKQATASRVLVGKELQAKTDELKLRISVLLAEDERDNPLDESNKASPVKRLSSRGAELNAKLKSVFDAMKDENNRLVVENRDVQVKLRRAEQAAKAARRKAKKTVDSEEELRVKIAKERVDMHFNLAVLYEKDGLFKDAEREYLKCLRLDPKDSGVHYNLGILYDDKINDNTKARYHYYKFLSLRPMGETAERVRDWITKLELENRLGKELR